MRDISLEYQEKKIEVLRLEHAKWRAYERAQMADLVFLISPPVEPPENREVVVLKNRDGQCGVGFADTIIFDTLNHALNE
jgi:hypothetical protein